MALRLHHNFAAEGDAGPFNYTQASYVWTYDNNGYLVKVFANNGHPIMRGGNYVNNLVWRSTGIGTWWTSLVNATTGTDKDDSLLHNGQQINLTKVTDDATSGRHQCAFINTISASGSDPLHYLFPRKIISCYVKKDDNRYVTMPDQWTTNGSIFDLDTGTWTFTKTNYTGGQEKLGPYTYRIWLVHTAPASGANDMMVGLSSGPDEGDDTYVGTGSSAYFGGAQWEVDPSDSRTTPGPYIPTEANNFEAKFFGSCDGIVYEEPRTNLIHYSSDFSNWTASGTPVVTDLADESPRGATDASTIEDNDGAGYEYVRSNVATTTSGATVTASAFFKKDAVGAATRFPMLRVALAGTATNRFDLVVDTSNGSIDTGTSAGTGTIDDEGVDTITLSNGEVFYRVWFVCNNNGVANTTAQVEIYPSVGSGSLLYNNISNAATGTITVYGAQAEEGAGMTSYIETGGAATYTRTAPTIRIGSADALGAQNEGAALVKVIATDGLTGGLDCALCIGTNGVASDSMYLSHNAGAARADHNTGTGDDGLCLQNGAIVADGTADVLACAFKSGTMYGSVNGSTMASIGNPDTSITAPASNLYDEITIGTHPDVAGWEFNGVISEVAIWDNYLEPTALNVATANGGAVEDAQPSVRNRKKERDRFRRRYRRT